MLKGIDISNWQKGINLDNCAVDFVVCKATESTNFVDKYCDDFVQKCIATNKLWGFYHFARPGDARAQAEYFVNNCKGYLGKGIPVLDFEDARLTTTWGEEFMSRFHELTQVWPVLYMNADFTNNRGYFASSWVKQKCGLWLAGYPKMYTSYPDSKCPYKHDGWTLAMWQFTSSLAMAGFRLDGDFAYMDRAAWGKYAQGERTETAPVPAVTEEKKVSTFEDDNFKVTVEEK